MKTRHTFFISFVLMVTASFMMQVVAQDLATGKKLAETNQWNKANQFFIDQVKKNPADPSLKFYLGETYFELGKLDSAENNFNRGIDYPFSIAGLGRIILSKGDTTKAKETFNKAIKGDRKNGDLYAYIVDACVSANYIKLAEQYYQRGKDVTTKNARLYLAAGNLAKLKGNAGEAANAYENAYYYDKSLALAYVKVGMIYTDSRTWDVATKNFEQALAIDPQYPLAFKGLGDMYYKSGRFPEASDNYKKYFANSEVSLDDNYRYAFILFYNQQFAEATKMIESLLVADAKNPVLLRLQAYISYELGMENGKVKNPESIKTALDNITRFFKNQAPNKRLSSDYEYFAKIQVASGLDSLAPANYMKAFEMDSSRTSLLDDGARLNSKLGLYLKAVPFYKTLIRISPENAAINSFKMGQQYFLEAVKNDTAKADSLIKKANLILADSAFKTVATLIPTSTLGTLWMAKTENYLDITGEKGLAKPYYEKVIEMNLTAPESTKKKNELIESYRYLGSYWYPKAYEALTKKKNKAEYEELKTRSLECWNKLLELAPNDPQPVEAKKAFIDLDKVKNKPQQQQQQ